MNSFKQIIQSLSPRGKCILRIKIYCYIRQGWLFLHLSGNRQKKQVLLWVYIQFIERLISPSKFGWTWLCSKGILFKPFLPWKRGIWGVCTSSQASANRFWSEDRKFWRNAEPWKKMKIKIASTIFKEQYSLHPHTQGKKTDLATRML